MHGPVLVADQELLVHAQHDEKVMGMAPVTPDAPPPLLVYQICHGVNDAVDVRRDVISRYPEVLCGIDNHGEIGGLDQLL